MRKRIIKTGNGRQSTQVLRVHTLVVGSGAAGLNAALQLWRKGIRDILIITEGLKMGTSINTGSDKQTYYKLAMCGDEADSPRSMAESYFAGGSMHGDLALVEASLSPQAFMNLVELGVPFPHDRFGQIAGYKTDHDPRRRATSTGPYTSRDMCMALIREIRALQIPLLEKRQAVELITCRAGSGKRAAGVVAVDEKCRPGIYLADNVVFAVGGPGGLYRASVYPNVHAGAIGVALKAGAKAQGLPESQHGLASVKFRWNVSGTYMQVIPRVISTDLSGGDEREFLLPYFSGRGKMNSTVFLKGYQWPFDAGKVIGGSSLIDILVYIETVQKGRRVFLDYRRNPTGYSLASLSSEASGYLRKSGALQKLPIERLSHMNPGAVELYACNGIDLRCEPLEVAVCSQHNNGGLAANSWWESLNIKHLFPVGEVNGSHGVYRPGGAALNAGQVGGIRAAEYIAHKYAELTLNEPEALKNGMAAAGAIEKWLAAADRSAVGWRDARRELQARMSEAGAHIRSAEALQKAVHEAWLQYGKIELNGCRGDGNPRGRIQALITRQLCLAHAVYLEAAAFSISCGAGSRGSAIVLDRAGKALHRGLGKSWRMMPENQQYRDLVQETVRDQRGRIRHNWVRRRPLPEPELWFENVWAQYRSGGIYGEK